MKGKKFHAQLAICGEAVHYMPAAKVKGKQIESRWFRGIWLGRSDRSHHHLIGDEFGNVVAAKAIKGLPEERRWDADLLAKLRGVPWALKGEVETEVRRRRRRRSNLCPRPRAAARCRHGPPKDPDTEDFT